MLIYDHNKTFLGIDDEDLRLFGFSTTEELLEACDNIADLFVKKPGYIHNFKNFQWIDFVLHSDAEHSKAIVDTGKKSFACDIAIKPFHLVESPGEQAYAVHLQHIKPLTSAEAAPAASSTPEPVQMPSTPSTSLNMAETSAAMPEAPTVEETLPLMPELQEDLPRFDDLMPTTLSEPESVEIPEGDYLNDPYDTPEDIYPDFNKPLEIEDDIFVTETPEVEEPVLEAPEPMAEVPAEQPVREEKPMLGDYLSPKEQEYAEQMKDFKDYVYDPHIAADELGLPVDLIEEFIGDFINQAHDFHDELFEASAKGDFENVKLLSHKLKGVAANLRIEDSFEMLAVINNSHDEAEVEAYLKMFYRTIAKLEGKEVGNFNAAAAPIMEELAPAIDDVAFKEPPVMEAPVEATPETTDDDDIYSFDIKGVAPAEEPAEPALQETADDDLYAFEAAPEPVIPSHEEPSEPLPEEDIYSFEKAVEPAIEERYEEPLLDEAPSFETPSRSDEDLYAFESVPEPEPETPMFGETAEPAWEEPAPAAGAELQPVPPMHYDMESAANELGLSKEVVEELISDFTAHANEVKASIEEAIADGQERVWRSEAAQMKGIADNLRMGEIATALQELESATDPQNAKAAAESLYSRIDQL